MATGGGGTVIINSCPGFRRDVWIILYSPRYWQRRYVINLKHSYKASTKLLVQLCGDPRNTANINLRIMFKMFVMFLWSSAWSSPRDVYSYLSDVLSAFYGARKGVLPDLKGEVGRSILPHCYGSLFPNTSLLSLWPGDAVTQTVVSFEIMYIGSSLIVFCVSWWDLLHWKHQWPLLAVIKTWFWTLYSLHSLYFRLVVLNNLCDQNLLLTICICICFYSFTFPALTRMLWDWKVLSISFRVRDSVDMKVELCNSNICKWEDHKTWRCDLHIIIFLLID
jgi:hypothetical protein